MSKSIEEFKELMESDRGEPAIYEKAGADDKVRMPITRDGFEALVARACELLEINVTGPIRNVSVSFLHSIPRIEADLTPKRLMDAIWNSLSNHMTFEIDQEIKKDAQEELRQEQESLRKAQEDLAKQKAIEKRQGKIAKKSGKTLSVASEDATNETSV